MGPRARQKTRPRRLASAVAETQSSRGPAPGDAAQVCLREIPSEPFSRDARCSSSHQRAVRPVICLSDDSNCHSRCRAPGAAARRRERFPARESPRARSGHAGAPPPVAHSIDSAIDPSFARPRVPPPRPAFVSLARVSSPASSLPTDADAPRPLVPRTSPFADAAVRGGRPRLPGRARGHPGGDAARVGPRALPGVAGRALVGGVLLGTGPRRRRARVRPRTDLRRPAARDAAARAAPELGAGDRSARTRGPTLRRDAPRCRPVAARACAAARPSTPTRRPPSPSGRRRPRRRRARPRPSPRPSRDPSPRRPGDASRRLRPQAETAAFFAMAAPRRRASGGGNAARVARASAPILGAEAQTNPRVASDDPEPPEPPEPTFEPTFEPNASHAEPARAEGAEEEEGGEEKDASASLRSALVRAAAELETLRAESAAHRRRADEADARADAAVRARRAAEASKASEGHANAGRREGREGHGAASEAEAEAAARLDGGGARRGGGATLAVGVGSVEDGIETGRDGEGGLERDRRNLRTLRTLRTFRGRRRGGRGSPVGRSARRLPAASSSRADSRLARKRKSRGRLARRAAVDAAPPVAARASSPRALVRGAAGRVRPEDGAAVPFGSRRGPCGGVGAETSSRGGGGGGGGGGFFEKTATMTARAVAAIELDEARRLGRRFDRADRVVASWAR